MVELVSLGPPYSEDGVSRNLHRPASILSITCRKKSCDQTSSERRSRTNGATSSRSSATSTCWTRWRRKSSSRARVSGSSVAVVAGLAHARLQMAKMHLRMMGRVPNQVVPIPPFHPALPLPAENGVQFARKQVRQAVHAHAERDRLQQVPALGLEPARRIRIHLQFDLQRLARRKPAQQLIRGVDDEQLPIGVRLQEGRCRPLPTVSRFCPVACSGARGRRSTADSQTHRGQVVAEFPPFPPYRNLIPCSQCPHTVDILCTFRRIVKGPASRSATAVASRGRAASPGSPERVGQGYQERGACEAAG